MNSCREKPTFANCDVQEGRVKPFVRKLLLEQVNVFDCLILRRICIWLQANLT